MQINYVENKNRKLFSFSQHDYKSNQDNEGNYIMIDGGFDYHRYSGELKSGEIKDIMPEIREQFMWGQNYDENNNRLPETIYKPLKDLTSSHIAGIIRYLIEKMVINEEFNIYCIGQQTKATLTIFCYELENRLKKNNGKEI